MKRVELTVTQTLRVPAGILEEYYGDTAKERAALTKTRSLLNVKHTPYAAIGAEITEPQEIK